MPVDITLVTHFVAVAQQLHFTRAAKSLNISRQALSSSVKKLEAELGVELFDRSAEGTQLSEAGEKFLAESLPRLDEEEQRQQELAEAEAAPSSLSIGFVPGVTVGKWTSAWEERHPSVVLRVRPNTEAESVSVLRDGIADVSFVRLPIKRHGLSVIPLYQETPVVVVAKDHPIALFDEVTLADLAEEQVARDPSVVSDAVELVAAGVGVLVVPQSIARLHARKDVVARPITDAPVTEIAIAWLEDELTADIEEFVGIVRGRTAGSSRAAAWSATAVPAPVAPPAKKSQEAAKGAKATKGKSGRPVQHSRGALQARNRKRGSRS
ncbi:MAG TPA: LysR family transcriptional regulator [Glaciihabitans sp.]|jgi:DNA-binding transcriptional LysR family regulator|nr:LysR family transcriptional regulator [Glaciihabitans sp.]